jgi:hypothetical protein
MPERAKPALSGGLYKPLSQEPNTRHAKTLFRKEILQNSIRSP